MKKIHVLLVLAAILLAGCVKVRSEGTVPGFSAVALDAAITGTRVDITTADHYAIQCVWNATGTPVGSIDIELSLDGTNWEDYDSQAVSGAGTKLWSVANAAYPMFRLVYNSTSGGTGSSCTCKYSTKGD